MHYAVMDPPGYGGEGGGGVITGLRRVSEGSQTRRGEKYWFFGEICCLRIIFARVFKVEIVFWY